MSLLENSDRVIEYPNNTPKAPLVSVIVQTYNHEKYIIECLESILAQKTIFEIEILIGEDDSSDETRKICKRYADKYPDKIKLFLHDRRNVIYFGQTATGRYNFIYNLENALGKYIAICEGDDYWTDPYKLQKQVDFLEENEEYSICFHNVKIWDESNQIMVDDYITREVSTTTTAEDLSLGNYIHTPSVVFKNKVKSFPHCFLTAPTGDYTLHAINSLYGKIYKFTDNMAIYRVHKKGLWNSHKNLKLPEQIIYNNRAILLYEFMYKESKIKMFRKLIYDLVQDNRKYNLLLNNKKEAKKCSIYILANHKKLIKFKQYFSLFLTLIFPKLLIAYYGHNDKTI